MPKTTAPEATAKEQEKVGQLGSRLNVLKERMITAYQEVNEAVYLATDISHDLGILCGCGDPQGFLGAAHASLTPAIDALLDSLADMRIANEFRRVADIAFQSK